MRRLLPLAALALAMSAGAQEPPPVEVEAAPAAAPSSSPVETSTKVEPDGSTTMTHSLTIAAPPAAVWAAISTAEGWQGWAAPVARWVEGERDVLETSYDPAEAPGGPGAIWQQFVARIPGRLLVFRTVKAPDEFPHWDEYRGVTVFVELTPEGEGTHVRLTSTGYPDSEGGRALVGFFAKGNAATLESLNRHFAVEAAADDPAPAHPTEDAEASGE